MVLKAKFMGLTFPNVSWLQSSPVCNVLLKSLKSLYKTDFTRFLVCISAPNSGKFSFSMHAGLTFGKVLNEMEVFLEQR